MKQLLVEIDDELAVELEKVAPGRKRQRSEFVRHAIRQALWDLEEKATAEAYQKQPDSEAEAYLDSRVWEPPPMKRTARRKR
jgi:predicted transcriptional regulator